MKSNEYFGPSIIEQNEDAILAETLRFNKLVENRCATGVRIEKRSWIVRLAQWIRFKIVTPRNVRRLLKQLAADNLKAGR